LTAPTEIPRRGDLDVGEVGEVEEGDGVALAGRQRGDRGEHPRAVSALLGTGRRGLRHRLERELRGRAPAGAQQRGLVALHERAEGGPVAPAGGGGEVGISRRGHTWIVPSGDGRVTRPLPSWIAA
jgi:hypothetical protein